MVEWWVSLGMTALAFAWCFGHTLHYLLRNFEIPCCNEKDLGQPIIYDCFVQTIYFERKRWHDFPRLFMFARAYGLSLLFITTVKLIARVYEGHWNAYLIGLAISGVATFVSIWTNIFPIGRTERNTDDWLDKTRGDDKSYTFLQSIFLLGLSVGNAIATFHLGWTRTGWWWYAASFLSIPGTITSCLFFGLQLRMNYYIKVRENEKWSYLSEFLAFWLSVTVAFTLNFDGFYRLRAICEVRGAALAAYLCTLGILFVAVLVILVFIVRHIFFSDGRIMEEKHDSVSSSLFNMTKSTEKRVANACLAIVGASMVSLHLEIFGSVGLPGARFGAVGAASVGIVVATFIAIFPGGKEYRDLTTMIEADTDEHQAELQKLQQQQESHGQHIQVVAGKAELRRSARLSQREVVTEGSPLIPSRAASTSTSTSPSPPATSSSNNEPSGEAASSAEKRDKEVPFCTQGGTCGHIFHLCLALGGLGLVLASNVVYASFFFELWSWPFNTILGFGVTAIVAAVIFLFFEKCIAKCDSNYANNETYYRVNYICESIAIALILVGSILAAVTLNAPHVFIASNASACKR